MSEASQSFLLLTTKNRQNQLKLPLAKKQVTDFIQGFVQNFCLLILLFGLFCFFPAIVQAKPVLRVAVASNFYATLSQLVPLYPESEQIQVELITGATGMLYNQILHGAPFDLFFAADKLRPAKLNEKGLSSKPSIYAIGQLALWDPHHLINNIQGIKKWQGTIALANPKLAPYGKATLKLFDIMQIDRDSVNLVMGNNINQSYLFIATQAAPLGFVAYSQVLNKKGVYLVPKSWNLSIEQALVILKKANKPQNPQAVKFSQWILTDPNVKKILAKKGYLTNG